MEVNKQANNLIIQSFIQKVNELKGKIINLNISSHAQSKRRKELVARHRQELLQKQSQYEKELAKLTAKNQPEYRKDSIGGLVIQVPENSQMRIPDSNPYLSSKSIYYISEVVKNYKDPRSIVRGHLITSIKILKALQNSKMPNQQQLKQRVLSLPKKLGWQNKKTVVFDLDQTLIHCNQQTSKQHDILINIKFPGGQQIKAGVNIRPHAIQLLNSLKGKYQVIIFTASHKSYANQILDRLDPTGELIHHRLYREHCYNSPEGYLVKDLRILGRQLANVLLVDNAAYSYAFQLDNGVPVLPYFQGKNDYELIALESYLLSLVNQPELRASNRKLFQLPRYLQFQDSIQNLVQELYLSCWE